MVTYLTAFLKAGCYEYRPQITPLRISFLQIKTENWSLLYDGWIFVWFIHWINLMNIWLNDLNAKQRDQTLDLFTLFGIHATVLAQPNKNLYSLEIGLNQTNTRLVEGVLSYIITYITQGEQDEYSDNK